MVEGRTGLYDCQSNQRGLTRPLMCKLRLPFAGAQVQDALLTPHRGSFLCPDWLNSQRVVDFE